MNPDTFCVVRVNTDETLMQSWTFAKISVAGKLLLERYSEYSMCFRDPHGLHEYVLVLDKSQTLDNLNTFRVPIPKDVVHEAAQQTESLL